MTFQAARKPLLIATAAATVLSGVGLYAWQQEHRAPLLEIYVFDLKSGRSVFIRTPEDRRILIDGGANSAVIRELTDILPFYSRRIDTIIATDTLAKNVAGLIDVLERYQVDRVVVPALTDMSLGLASSTGTTYETFASVVAGKGIPVTEMVAGDSEIFGLVSIEALFPAPASGFEYSKASPPALILRISYKDTSMILLGDASLKTQKYLAARIGTSAPAHAEVLYVPHSVSANALSAELVTALRPESVIYSESLTAKKPSASSAKNKQAAEPLATVLRDRRFNLKEEGRVKAVSDGREVSVTAERTR